MAEIADYEWLTSAEAASWLQSVSETDEPVHRRLNCLRKVLSVEQSRLVVEQVELRHRAVAKFGELASRMFFTDVAMQQATDLWIARYKAQRIGSDILVNDYCCGIGGDLLALAERGSVVGWDQTPEIVVLAEANLRAAGCDSWAQVQLGDVQQLTPSAEEVWHLDPDRRAGGRRSTQVRWHSPGPELVDRWLKVAPHGALKLAPATIVPEPWQEQAELQWISRDRECRQLVVWFGRLARTPGRRCATALSKAEETNMQVSENSFCGDPDSEAPVATKIGAYVYEADPAVRAAGLTGSLAVDQGLVALAPGAVYLTSDRCADHPLLSCFQVIDQLPLRIDTLSQYLRSTDIGHLEIKKRGVEIQPEKLRRQLKLRGNDRATLLLTRMGVREIAVLARRYSKNADPMG